MLLAQTLPRLELEEIWRRRLEKSHARYKIATPCYRRLIQQEVDDHYPIPDSPLARARRAKSHAVMEYLNVLQIFTDLTIHGKMPDETGEDAKPFNAQGGNEVRVVDDDGSIRDSTKMPFALEE